MKKLFLWIYLAVISTITDAQNSSNKLAILYGRITKDSLLQPSFKTWYTQGYEEYQPDAAVINALKKINMKNITVTVFLGTWCGDSRREVPRFFKILDAIAFPGNSVEVFGLGSQDSLYKQSPQHEERGKGIFRVPVFIIYKNGKEINRINEFPVISLEKDLYAILAGESYSPNYRSFSLIRNWLADGVLTDRNSNSNGLALQVKYLVAGEWELNGLGYLLVKQGKKEEALGVFRINANLYPESANVISSLGEGYRYAGDDSKAISFLERSLELNKDPRLVKEILKILYEAKGVK